MFLSQDDGSSLRFVVEYRSQNKNPEEMGYGIILRSMFASPIRVAERRE